MMKRHPEHHDAADDAFDALLREALGAFEQKQRVFTGAIEHFSAWHIDEEAAMLRLTGSVGKEAHYRIIPIGTYLPESGSFAWAWGNEAFPEASRRNASRIQDLAARTGYAVFEMPQLHASPTDVDELCALALHPLNGAAVFKAKNSIPWVYYSVE